MSLPVLEDPPRLTTNPPPSSPYRAPIHREIVPVTEVEPRLSPSVGPLLKASAITLVARGLSLGFLWWNSDHTTDSIARAGWPALFSIVTVLGWLSTVVSRAKKHQWRSMTRAIVIEALTLFAALAAIEALPWSSRWWIELCAVGSLVVFVVAIAWQRATAPKRSAFE